MDFTPFYEKCKELPDNERRWATVFCRHVDEVFGNSDAQLHNIDKICTLFYGYGSGLSKAQFYRKRKLVMMLYSWLFENGRIDLTLYNSVAALRLEDVIRVEELNRYYFQSLDSALGFVSVVARMNNMSPDHDLLNVKSLVILLWHGVDLNDITNIKKNDVLFDGVVMRNGDRDRFVQIEAKYTGVLAEFASTEIHNGFPSGKVQEYLPSSYLFRSSRVAQMSANNINCMLRRFNEDAEQYGHTLSVVALKKNGIFCKVYESQDKERISEKLQEILQCNHRAELYEYVHLYQGWERKFNVLDDVCEKGGGR